MKYGIDYRFLPKGGAAPVDNTQPVDVEVDHDQFALIPNVGDYVDFPGEDDIRHVPLKGRVKSRCFNYKLGYCYVTIVIEETEDDWNCIKP